MCINICKYLCIYICIRIRICIYIYQHVSYICEYLCIYIHICAHIYMYFSIYSAFSSHTLTHLLVFSCCVFVKSHSLSSSTSLYLRNLSKSRQVRACVCVRARVYVCMSSCILLDRACARVCVSLVLVCSRACSQYSNFAPTKMQKSAHFLTPRNVVP